MVVVVKCSEVIRAIWSVGQIDSAEQMCRTVLGSAAGDVLVVGKIDVLITERVGLNWAAVFGITYWARCYPSYR
jgi:hypothetical protein